MRRRVRAIHLARRRLKPFLLKLKSTPAEEWPPHLKIAFELLKKKSTLSDAKILSLIIGSVAAAHACAQTINRKSDSLVQFRVRINLSDAFRRIRNCAKRAPLKLRRRLNEGIIRLIRENPVDLEVIEAIFDAVVAAFREFPNEEASRTAIRLIFGKPEYEDKVGLLKRDYSVVGNAYQRKCENSIAALAKSINNKTVTSEFFNSLAETLDPNKSNKFEEESSSEIHQLIEQYVAAIAKIWLDYGLRPSRARIRNNPQYKSMFHRFADLVLTAMVEPWSNRHRKDLSTIGQNIRKAHDEIPKKFRDKISPRLRRSDSEWLVTDGHVKKALRMAIQKTDHVNP